MNRRAFLASVLAAPVAAALPDIRRPRFYTGAVLTAEAIDRALRLVQNATDTAAAVLAAAKTHPPGWDQTLAMHEASMEGVRRAHAIVVKAPEGIVRGELRPGPLRLVVGRSQRL